MRKTLKRFLYRHRSFFRIVDGITFTRAYAIEWVSYLAGRLYQATMPKPRAILVILFFGVGDVIRSTAIVERLKKKYPDATLHYLTKDSSEPILRYNPYIDRIFIESEKEKVLLERYDWIINLHLFDNYPSARELMGRLKAPLVSGGRYLAGGRYWRVSSDLFRICVERHFHAALLSFKMADIDRERIYLAPDHEKRLGDLVKRFGFPPDAVVIGFNLGALNHGSINRFRNMPLGSIAKMVEAIVACGFSVVVTGRSSDRRPDEQRELAGLFSDRAGVINLIDALNIDELILIIKRCACYVSTDTGPAHIALALGTPLVALFGQTRGAMLISPRMKSNRLSILQSAMDCSPCSWRLREECEQRDEGLCMECFSVKTVIGEIERLLETNPKCAERGMMAQIKILFITDNVVCYGGAETQLARLVQALEKESRFDVRLIWFLRERDRVSAAGDLSLNDNACPDLTAFDSKEARGCAVRISRNKFLFLWRLVRAIRSYKPDIVETRLSTADLYGRVAAWLSGVPVIISSQRGAEFVERDPRYAINAVLGVITTCFIANARAVGRYLVEKCHINKAKIRIVYNGIDCQSFRCDESERRRVRADVGVDAGEQLIVTIARFEPVKDHATLVRAAKKVLAIYRNVKFLFIGRGTLERSIIGLAEELGIRGSIIIRGEVSAKGVQRFYWASDACVLTSTGEGCSNFILEAMASSRPVIASDVGGNSELIVEGVTGYLVAAGDDAVFADRILHLVEHQDVARRMGEEGRKEVERSFSVEKMVRQTCALYEELHEKSRLSGRRR